MNVRPHSHKYSLHFYVTLSLSRTHPHTHLNIYLLAYIHGIIQMFESLPVLMKSIYIANKKSKAEIENLLALTQFVLELRVAHQTNKASTGETIYIIFKKEESHWQYKKEKQRKLLFRKRKIRNRKLGQISPVFGWREEEWR